MPSFSDGPGKIFSIDLTDPRIKPVELRMTRNFDVDSFNPHGISTFIDQSGTIKVRSIDPDYCVILVHGPTRQSLVRRGWTGMQVGGSLAVPLGDAGCNTDALH